jgi:hypothetical protein
MYSYISKAFDGSSSGASNGASSSSGIRGQSNRNDLIGVDDDDDGQDIFSVSANHKSASSSSYQPHSATSSSSSALKRKQATADTPAGNFNKSKLITSLVDDSSDEGTGKASKRAAIKKGASKLLRNRDSSDSEGDDNKGVDDDDVIVVPLVKPASRALSSGVSAHMQEKNLTAASTTSSTRLSKQLRSGDETDSQPADSQPVFGSNNSQSSMHRDGAGVDTSQNSARLDDTEKELLKAQEMLKYVSSVKQTLSSRPQASQVNAGDSSGSGQLLVTRPLTDLSAGGASSAEVSASGDIYIPVVKSAAQRHSEKLKRVATEAERIKSLLAFETPQSSTIPTPGSTLNKDDACDDDVECIRIVTRLNGTHKLSWRLPKTQPIQAVRICVNFSN